MSTTVFKAVISFILIAASSIVGTARAETNTDSTGWNGTAGVGPIAFPRYVGGKQARTWLVPLLSINYNDTYYVELERIGTYLLASENKKAGLGVAVEPRFGYSAKDGVLLSGMRARRDSLEGGPTFDWDFDVVAVSFAWFHDLDRSSRGQSARAAAYAPIVKNNIWEAGLLFSLDRMNGRLTNYFFGVTPAEATPLRPEYRATGGTNESLGLSGTYKLGKRQVLMFGLNATRLAHAAADSPIVETRRANMLYLGYGWTL